MKKYILHTIGLVAIFFTGCYTEVGYDYEREAYWDKVEGVERSERDLAFDEENYEADQDSSDYYADEEYYPQDEEYEDFDDYNYFRDRRHYEYYYPSVRYSRYLSLYDPWWDGWWPYYSHYPYYSHWYPYSYYGWYNSGYYGWYGHHHHYYDHYNYGSNYYFTKTKTRTNWN